MLCVLSVFFVLAHGPYSAVHGPMTALRSLRNRLQLAFAMWLAALGLGRAALLVREFPSWPSPVSDFPSCSIPLDLAAVLRC